MIFRSFQIRIIIRVLILGILVWVFIFSISRQHWYVASVTSFGLVLVSLVELVRFLNRTNRDLGNFLLSIKHNDLTNYYSGKIPEKSFRGLEQAFNEIIELYRQAKIDKEVHYQYLQNVISHINTAVICIREDGSIELFNRSAKKLLGAGDLVSLEQVREIDAGLHNVMSKIAPGENRLHRTIINGEILQLSIFCTYFKLMESPYRLISLQNIKNELEEQELESWQKLIRVLTHEIMNSVTPVSSLSTAVNEMFHEEDGSRKRPDDIPADDLEDFYQSLETIEERSRWLIDFLGSYKNLTRLPKPDFRQVSVDKLLKQADKLMKKEFEQHGIEFRWECSDERLEICADEKMIQQVIINLLSNAIDALNGAKDKKITLSSGSSGGHIYIQVIDNGPGIDEENADKIFIPFFTTKKKGSGIGLNLARQIMRAHKGNIRFQTMKSGGTSFILEF